MSFQEFQAIGRLIQQADPSDFEEIQAIHNQILRLRDVMEMGHAQDIASCLDAAALLVESLPHRQDVDPADFLATVSRLLATVQTNFAINRGAVTSPGFVKAEASPPEAKPAPQRVTRGSVHVMNEMLLGEVLLNLGAVNEEQLAQAIELQKESGEKLGDVLLSMGILEQSSIEIAVRLQEQLRAANCRTQAKAKPQEPAPAAEPRQAAPVQEPPAASPAEPPRPEKAKVGKPINLAMPVPAKPSRGLEIMSDSLLGQVLIRIGAIRREQLEQALKIQRAAGIRIGEALVELGATTWEVVEKAVELQRDKRGPARGTPLDGDTGMRESIQL
jgi:hypothetical protein